MFGGFAQGGLINSDGTGTSEGRTTDQQDAYSVARWLSLADHRGTLMGFLNRALPLSERAVAEVEGWILGVAGSPHGS